MRAAGPLEREMAAFADRILALIHNAQPVRIYTGCGTNPASGFINRHRADAAAGQQWDDRDTLFGNNYADLLK